MQLQSWQWSIRNNRIRRMPHSSLLLQRQTWLEAAEDRGEKHLATLTMRHGHFSSWFLNHHWNWSQLSLLRRLFLVGSSVPWEKQIIYTRLTTHYYTNNSSRYFFVSTVKSFRTFRRSSSHNSFHFCLSRHKSLVSKICFVFQSLRSWGIRIEEQQHQNKWSDNEVLESKKSSWIRRRLSTEISEAARRTLSPWWTGSGHCGS